MKCFSWSPGWLLGSRCDAAPCSPSRHAAESSMSIRRTASAPIPVPVVGDTGAGTTRKFTLAQLSAATDGFHESKLLGEGGFGRVYRGRLRLDEDDVVVEVAVKQLVRGGAQGTREFLVECTMLMMLHHPNLVSLVGYCATAGERLLVYELMPGGSLDARLFRDADDNADADDAGAAGLSWDARARIALGTARGLRYLHEEVRPAVIYRDLKSSNILLGPAPELSPKLSDLGLARLGPDPSGDDTHVSTRVMGTYGYCAPDYAGSGKLSVRSDVYSFGVVLLELLTGCRASDGLLPWARPYLLKLKPRRLWKELADPALQGRYPRRGFYQLTVVASLCLRDNPSLRPTMGDVVQALEHVADHPYTPSLPTTGD